MLGGLPRPIGSDGEAIDDEDAAVRRVIEAQAEAGLEPLTDGRLRAGGTVGPAIGLGGVEPGMSGPVLTGPPTWSRPLTVDAWRFAVGVGAGLVKQTLPGPYTLGRRLGAADPEAATAAFARALRQEIDALIDAGCVLIEIEERDAHLIGVDAAERRRFVEAHQSMLDGITGVHLSLAIVGGNADTAGIETILAAPYRSLAVDLIDGPDNWRLVTRTPADRGIVCGALSVHDPSDDSRELLLWAASYASASGPRGRERVGLATSGSLAGLSWAVAERKMRRLGEATRLAGQSFEEAAPHLDPRAIDIRSAAHGRYLPPKPRKPRGPVP
ncbi:MAG: hypothetical protein ABI598_03255 [Chloroflexota bacterium]